MKHNILITVLVILALAVIGLITYVALKPDRAIAPVATEQKIMTQKTQPTTLEKKVTEQSVKDEIKKTGSELVSVDAEWNKYTNHTLGFSMNVPKSNDYNFYEENCKFSKDVVVISDDKTGRVYIGSPQSECNETCFPFSFEAFDQKCKGVQSDLVGGAMIQVEKMQNTAESFNAFLQKRKMYDNCTSNGTVLPDGKFDIHEYLSAPTKSMGDPGAEDQCFVNFEIFMFYSNKEQKIAVSELGQDVRFYKDSEDYSTTDQGKVQQYTQARMFNSFKFE